MGRRQRLMLLVLATAALALALSACGGGGEESGEETGGETINVPLAEQNGSGQTGTATLTEKDGQVTVSISLGGAPSEAQPAHIHPGTCASLGATPEYALANVVDGESETTIDATLDKLTVEQYAINIHMSEADIGTYAACGDIHPGY